MVFEVEEILLFLRNNNKGINELWYEKYQDNKNPYILLELMYMKSKLAKYKVISLMFSLCLAYILLNYYQNNNV